MNTEKFCFDPLPEGFMLPKPVNSVKDEVILALERQGRLAITRKRNGYRIWAVRTNVWKLYTRGHTEVTAYFPHIVEELNLLDDMPQTFLDGEMIFEKNGQDDFPTLVRIMKAGSPRKARIMQEELGKTSYMIFGIVFWDGEKYVSKPWQERQDKLVKEFMSADIQNALKGHPLPPHHLRHIFPVELLHAPFKEAEAYALEQKWEGLVLYDTEGCSDFSLDGKVTRPRVAWKRKPVYEDDFIVRRWIPRKNNPPLVKEFILSQIDPETGNEIDCGKCGSGLSNQDRVDYANNALYPLVVEVKFYDRFRSGKLQFASIVRIRDDKNPDECLYQKEDNE